MQTAINYHLPENAIMRMLALCAYVIQGIGSNSVSSRATSAHDPFVLHKSSKLGSDFVFDEISTNVRSS